MTTQQKTNAVIIKEMMTEGYGRSLFDSGSFYGYQNDIRVENDFTNAPVNVLDKDGYSRSLYHHLCSFIEIDAEKNDAFMAFVRQHPDEDTWGVFHMWLEENGYKVKHVENTCNGEHVLDGQFQCYELYYPNEDMYGSAITTHNGCDERSGYSIPRITCNFFDDFFGNMFDATIHCTKCESTLSSEGGYIWRDDLHRFPYKTEIKLSELWDNDKQHHCCVYCDGHYVA